MDTATVIHLLIIVLQIAQILVYALPKIIGLLNGQTDQTAQDDDKFL